jgi:hypothetical protein
MKLLFLITSFFITLAHCEAGSPDISNILEVSKFDITLNNKPASYIKFGKNQNESCNLAVLKESVNKHYRIEINGSDSTVAEVDLTCMLGDQYFALSYGDDTYVKVAVKELNKDKIIYNLNAKIQEVTNQSYYELKDVNLILTGKSFSYLKN